MARKAQNANVFEEGRERIENALKDLEKDWKKFQTDAEKRRKGFEKRAEKEVKRLRAEFKKNPWVKRAQKQARELEQRGEELREEIESTELFKRADGIRKDATKAVEEQVETLYDNLRIASVNDVHSLEKKISRLSKKVRDLEKTPAGKKKARKAA